MRTVPLQQICDIQIGKTPSRSVPEYWGGDLPWVTIGDFAAGRIVTNTKERITRIGATKSGSKRIPQGTLLLSFKLSLGERTIQPAAPSTESTGSGTLRADPADT